MLNFDPWAELEKIRAEKCTPATPATHATFGSKRSKVAEVARGVLSGKTSIPQNPSSQANAGPKLVYTSDDDALAFAAIVEGCQTYGTVATTTRMGATRAFQATERLKSAERIQQAKDGSLSIAEEQTSHD